MWTLPFFILTFKCSNLVGVPFLALQKGWPLEIDIQIYKGAWLSEPNSRSTHELEESTLMEEWTYVS